MDLLREVSKVPMTKPLNIGKKVKGSHNKEERKIVSSLISKSEMF